MASSIDSLDTAELQVLQSELLRPLGFHRTTGDASLRSIFAGAVPEIIGQPLRRQNSIHCPPDQACVGTVVDGRSREGSKFDYL
jgi:hypothetical protein